MEIIKGEKTAILIDSNSLVGHHCLKLLLESNAYERIIAFSDEKPKIEHPRLVFVSLELSNQNLLMPEIKGQDLFWCRSSFKDWFDITSISSIRNSLPFRIAMEALDKGASQMIFLSSRIIQKNTWLPILKQRSLLEEAIIQLPFWSTHIFKPAFLYEGTSFSKLGGLFLDNLAELVGDEIKEFQPVPSKILAQAMVEAAQNLKSGLHYHYVKDMQSTTSNKA